MWPPEAFLPGGDDDGRAAADPRPGLASNATWRLAGTIVRVLVGLISVPVYTRVLGMPQWGLLALFQAATSPLAFLDLGFGAATVKYVAESVGRGDRDDAARVVHTTLLFNLAMGSVGVVALLASSRWLSLSLFAIPPAEVPRAIAGFRLTALSWFVSVFTATYSGVVSAHQRYDSASKLATLSMVLSVGGGLATAALGGDIVAVLVTQCTVAALMAFVWFRNAVQLLPGVAALPRWDRGVFRRSFSFGVWQSVAAVGSFLSGWADRYILGANFVPTIVGFYAVANLLYTQLYGVFGEMGEVLFPAVSHLEGRGDLPGARRLALLAGWTLATGFGISAVVLAVIGGDFVHLWVSAETARQATTTLRLLCIGGIIGMPALAPFYYLLGIGKTRWDAAAAIAIGLSVLLVGLLLIPQRGLAAVGYGLIVGLLTRWVFVFYIWRTHFSRDVAIGSFAAHVWAPPLVSLAGLLSLCWLHDLLGRAPSWPWLFCEAALACALAGAFQLGMGELLPGGRQRRLDVFYSFRPVLAKALGRFSPSLGRRR